MDRAQFSEIVSDGDNSSLACGKDSNVAGEEKKIALLDSMDVISFSQAKEYWLLGEWDTLAQIDVSVLKQHDKRTDFLLLIMSAHQQLGDKNKVQEYVDLALRWGCSRAEIASLLLRGVYNFFGLIIALRGKNKEALKYFEKSITWSVVNVVKKQLRAELRMASQLRRLNIIVSLFYKNKKESYVNFDVLDAKEKKSTKQLIVLGMHRSGTSCITGVFHSMGAYFSSEKHAMKKDIGNPKGYFERVDSMVLNNHLLSESNSTWWQVSNFNLNNISTFNLNEIKKKYRIILEELNDEYFWVTKDPRLCLIFPLLEDLFDDPIFIHIYRNPIEVALSLNKRNGFPMSFGLALWEFYNKKAFSNSKGKPKILISYSDLLERSDDIILSLKSHLYEYFNIRLKIKNDDGLAPFAVDKSLYRNRVSESEMDEWLTGSQRIFSAVPVIYIS